MANVKQGNATPAPQWWMTPHSYAHDEACPATSPSQPTKTTP